MQYLTLDTYKNRKKHQDKITNMELVCYCVLQNVMIAWHNRRVFVANTWHNRHVFVANTQLFFCAHFQFYFIS